ncbi:MAG TPA: TonB family protein [Steroidobacteraceae bacterium]|nr:TonB family protein [Steroidobacteraceae bacterium]
MRKLLAVRLFAALGLLAASVAHADLFTAGQAYDKKEYEKAFGLYMELAQLGQAEAQRNVAIMYVTGEGVARDNVAGYAWAQIAAENGVGAEVQNILDQLGPHISEKARKRIDEITGQFGRAALESQLMPTVFPGQNFPTQQTPCKLAKAGGTVYPPDAQRNGMQGQVYMEFTVMPDGRARNPRVVYAVPPKVFDDAARRVILRSEFTPALEKNVPVPCTAGTMVQYQLKGVQTSDYSDLKAFIKKKRAEAESGDASAQMLYGLMISGLPQVRQPRGDAMPYFVKAAQAGLPTAQFLVGYSTMLGWGCECNEPKGMVWLQKAAAADQSDAQVMLANYILRGTPGEAEVAKALTWLERAARADNHYGKFYLAALLAAGPDATRREPKRALAVLKDVMRDVDDDPTSFEIRAAALAMLGDFEGAQKDQRRALKMARDLGWETASQETRLSSYVAGKPWTGDLFAF